MPVAGVVALAALWPLTAYAFDPVVLPALLAVAVAAAVILLRPEIGIALVLALAPFLNVTFGAAGVKPLVYLLAGGLAVYPLLLVRRHGQAAPRSLTLAVVAWVGVAVLSAVAGIAPGGSAGRVALIAATAALYAAVLAVCRTRDELMTVVAGALAGLALAGAHGLAQNFLGFDNEFSFVSGGEVVARVQGAFGHPNEYGGYLAVLIPLALVVAASARFSARLRALAAVALLLAVPALFYTYARGPALAVAAGLLVWTSVLRPKLAVPVALALVVAAFVAMPSAYKERLQETSGGDVTLRSDIWKAAVTIYSDHPVTGVGPNNFARAYSALPTELPGAAQRRLLHTSQVLVPPYAENLYLHVLAELGLLGLLALLTLLAAALYAIYRGSRARDPAARAVAFAVGAGVITLAFHGVVQVTLFTEIGFPVLALLGVAGRVVTLDWAQPADSSAA